MDPVTAVGLASSIVAFITFSTSLLKGAIKSTSRSMALSTTIEAERQSHTQ